MEYTNTGTSGGSALKVVSVIVNVVLFCFYYYLFFLRSPAISQEAKYRLVVDLFLMTNLVFIYGKTISFGLMA